MTSAVDQTPESDRPRVLLMGIGAMGGVFAARLIQAGHAPTLVAGSRMADVLTSRGITLLADMERSHHAVVAYPSVNDIPAGPPFDVVLILTKATAMIDAARAAAERSSPSTVFVALQNGIVEPAIASVVGEDRVVASLLNWAATMHEPGVYERTA